MGLHTCALLPLSVNAARGVGEPGVDGAVRTPADHLRPGAPRPLRHQGTRGPQPLPRDGARGPVPVP